MDSQHQEGCWDWQVHEPRPPGESRSDGTSGLCFSVVGPVSRRRVGCAEIQALKPGPHMQVLGHNSLLPLKYQVQDRLIAQVR